MPRTKAQNPKVAGSDRAVADKPAETTQEPRLTDGEQQQLVEIEQLRSITLDLVKDVQAMKIEANRNDAIDKALNRVRSDIVATRAMLSSAPGKVTGVEYGGSPHPAVVDECCGCSPCDCISQRCCSFDVIMTHIRATHMQIEPVDSNINPLGKMEIRIWPEIFGKGPVYPSLWGHIEVHKTLIDPGVWEGVGNLLIDTVQVCKGHPKTIPIALNAVEIDSIEAGPLEALTALRSEWGTNTEQMTLDCCCGTPPVIDIEVQFTGGSAVARGAIQGRFTARKKCC